MKITAFVKKKDTRNSRVSFFVYFCAIINP